MSEPDRFDWYIHQIEDDGEFGTWATLVLIEDGKVIERKRFSGTSEEPPGHTGEELARSYALAWHEAMTTTIEERLGPYGIEWQREQEERHGRQ